MICDIFLPIMPEILCKYCTLGREVQSCANLAYILCIGEISTILCKSCAYIAHWGNKYNLAQTLRIYCASGKELQYIAHILRIGRESCANLAHILRIDTSNAQLAHLAQNTISLYMRHHSVTTK